MPNFNGTGPLGQGSGSGWGRGPCGCGLKRGWTHFAHSFGRRFWSNTNTKKALEQEEKMLEEELNAIRQEKKNLKEQK